MDLTIIISHFLSVLWINMLQEWADSLPELRLVIPTLSTATGIIYYTFTSLAGICIITISPFFASYLLDAVTFAQPHQEPGKTFHLQTATTKFRPSLFQ